MGRIKIPTWCVYCTFTTGLHNKGPQFLLPDMAQIPLKPNVLNFQLLQSPHIIQPQDVAICVLSSLVQACQWVSQTLKKVKDALIEEEHLGPEIGRNWMQPQGQAGRKKVYLLCVWLYFEARCMSGRRVKKKVPGILPFTHLHYAWLGQEFPQRTTVYWQGREHIQGCTGRSLNYFRKDRGRKCSKKSELFLNSISLQEKWPQFSGSCVWYKIQYILGSTVVSLRWKTR